jgi:hypothetical protein
MGTSKDILIDKIYELKEEIERLKEEIPTQGFYTLNQTSRLLKIKERTLKSWHERKLKHPHKYLVTYNEGASGQLLIPVSEYKRIRDLIKSGELKTVHKNKNREGA